MQRNGEAFVIPKVHFTKGDRNDFYGFIRSMKNLSNKLGIGPEAHEKKWQAVVDFCGFKPKDLKAVHAALRGCLEIFIFISTDSVYEASDPSVRRMGMPVKEEDAIRPEDFEMVYKLKDLDSYAHHKLKCEEFLWSLGDARDFPYVCLRLPDVIGPYDRDLNYSRFWCYMKWIQISKEKPIHLNERVKTKKLSFVFSDDVVDLILELISYLFHRITGDRQSIRVSILQLMSF
eukprot:TRINITY_DN930_c0_g1_i21.p1 TRINITY_DN930_c0_g1~~TRINITY_DN930_c0_g1_i21.p1  ORF type:complete len:232 (+),score=13.72 TRINITY_DN930_c0_g1_i21:222-917(+)